MRKKQTKSKCFPPFVSLVGQRKPRKALAAKPRTSAPDLCWLRNSGSRKFALSGSYCLGQGGPISFLLKLSPTSATDASLSLEWVPHGLSRCLQNSFGSHLPGSQGPASAMPSPSPDGDQREPRNVNRGIWAQGGTLPVCPSSRMQDATLRGQWVICVTAALP